MCTGPDLRIVRRFCAMIPPVPMALLFTLLTLCFGALAIATALAGQWVIAFAAGALCAWLATLATAALRKTRR